MFCFFLFLINIPKKCSEPLCRKSFPSPTSLLMSSSQPQQIPHLPVEEARAGREQRQELQCMANNHPGTSVPRPCSLSGQDLSCECHALVQTWCPPLVAAPAYQPLGSEMLPISLLQTSSKSLLLASPLHRWRGIPLPASGNGLWWSFSVVQHFYLSPINF